MSTDVMDPDLLRYLAVFENPETRPVFHRACQECRRKKTKCNMKRPSCSLCDRTGASCVYPTTRKSGQRSRPRNNPSRTQPSLANEAHGPDEDLSTYSWDALFDVEYSPDALLSQPIQELPQIPPAAEQAQHAFSGAFFNDGSMPIGQEPSFRCNTGGWFNDKEVSAQIPNMNSGNVFPNSSVVHGPNIASNLSPPSSNSNATEGSPSTLWQYLQPTNLLSLAIPETTADELIELFFERVQLFLPLLHRPKFESEFFDINGRSPQRYENLDLETALLLNAMFSLSARFSTKGLSELEPKKRGLRFAEKARAIYDHFVKSDEKPSLRFLQGFVLLTFYDLTSKPSFQGWLSTGTCCRIAYSLSLHQIDKDPPTNEDPLTNAWLEKEEKRRAWWAIYQMDNFTSAIASRPFNIDSSRMNVFLPVSDAAWFANCRTSSVPLSGQGLLWRSLIDCENQSPYAWFLVCNGLLRAAYQEFDKQERSVQDIKILQSALHCFGLCLPPIFRSLYGNFLVGDQNWADKNWVICTLILLQHAQIFTAIALEKTTASVQANNEQDQTPEFITSNIGRTRGRLLHERLSDICGHYIDEHIRGVKLWSPDAIIFATPLVTCALIGPAAVYTAKPSSSSDSPGTTTLRSLEWQILDLALSRFAEYWELGKNMQDLFKRLIESPSESDPSPTKENTWIVGLLPEILQLAK